MRRKITTITRVFIVTIRRFTLNKPVGKDCLRKQYGLARCSDPVCWHHASQEAHACVTKVDLRGTKVDLRGTTQLGGWLIPALLQLALTRKTLRQIVHSDYGVRRRGKIGNKAGGYVEEQRHPLGLTPQRGAPVVILKQHPFRQELAPIAGVPADIRLGHRFVGPVLQRRFVHQVARRPRRGDVR